VHWNTEHGADRGFWEPLNSYDFSHATREGAVRDAKEWAAAEEIECRA
jgi:hypothetical protein